MLGRVSNTLVLDDAVVLPMQARGARAEALAIRGGRVLCVGTRREVRRAAGPEARSLSLSGRAVLPGFIDAHHHFLQAVVYAGTTRLEDARDHAELAERLARSARALPKGQWVIGRGYDPALLSERRYPSRSLLDDACPEHPVLAIEYSFHDGVTNSAGLARMGFDRHTPDPQGGSLGRDRRGALNGRVSESALFAVEAVAREARVVLDAEGILERIPSYEAQLFARGITCVCEPGVPPIQEALFVRAAREGRLRMPVVMMPNSAHGFGVPPRDRLDGPTTGEGSDALRVGPMKLVLDGATRCAMCLSLTQVLETSVRGLRAAFAQRSLAPIRALLDAQGRLGADLKLRSGTRYYSGEQSRAMVREACERGFAVAIHAIGNEAVDQALDAIAGARTLHRDVPPPRIEHATVLTPAQARRAADLGIAVAMQPDFIRLPAIELLPPPRGFRYLGARTLIDSQVLVAGSSDAPVTGFDPLDGMRSAIRRQTRSGHSFQRDEALDAWDALALYTRNAAAACGVLDSAGTLEPGKRADLVVLDADPSDDPDALETARVEQTYVAGERVYARASDAAGTGANARAAPSRVQR